MLNCEPVHDWIANLISVIVILGISGSYAPQHYRIIKAKSSEGFSPLFLLLGSTSAAAGMWNMITVQWSVVRCCSHVRWGECVEMTAGISQVFVQWFCFTLIFVLYIRYYPDHLKYVQSPTGLDLSPDTKSKHQRGAKTEAWKFTLQCAWITFWHFTLSGAITIYLTTSTSITTTTTPVATGPTLLTPHLVPEYISLWATFLGITSAILAAIQYTPQLIHTYRLKLVGVLSIPMMCINAPGSVFMITSIALRPGTNWTSWFTFLVAGIMQGTLLFICICWKIRQRRLGIDDFGRPIPIPSSDATRTNVDESSTLIRK